MTNNLLYLIIGIITLGFVLYIINIIPPRLETPTTTTTTTIKPLEKFYCNETPQISLDEWNVVCAYSKFPILDFETENILGYKEFPYSYRNPYDACYGNGRSEEFIPEYYTKGLCPHPREGKKSVEPNSLTEFNTTISKFVIDGVTPSVVYIDGWTWTRDMEWHEKYNRFGYRWTEDILLILEMEMDDKPCHKVLLGKHDITQYIDWAKIHGDKNILEKLKKAGGDMYFSTYGFCSRDDRFLIAGTPIPLETYLNEFFVK